MSYGVLFLRVALGFLVAAHGTQKLFGSFGGDGLHGTAALFGRLGFRAPLVTALAVGSSEFVGGVLLASGFLTPLAALAVAVVMVSAIVLVHGRNGFWNTHGGYEFNVLIWAAAVGLAATGGGPFSLDALAGWADDLSGPWSGVGVAAASVLMSAAVVAIGRRPALPGSDRRAGRAHKLERRAA